MGADNRDSERVPAFLRIKLKYGDVETFVEKYSTNLSKGGIFIASRTPKPIGTPLRFELCLQDASKLIRGEGIVSWVKEFDEKHPLKPHGMGVRFTRLDPESRLLVERMLEYKERTGQGTNPRIAAPGTNPRIAAPGTNPRIPAPGTNPRIAAPGTNPRIPVPARRADASVPPVLPAPNPIAGAAAAPAAILEPEPSIQIEIIRSAEGSTPTPAPQALGSRVERVAPARQPTGHEAPAVETTGVASLKDALAAIARTAPPSSTTLDEASEALDRLAREAQLGDGALDAAARVALPAPLTTLAGALADLERELGAHPAPAPVPDDPIAGLAALLGVPPPYRRAGSTNSNIIVAPVARSAPTAPASDDFTDSPATVASAPTAAVFTMEADEPSDEVDSALDRLFGE